MSELKVLCVHGVGQHPPGGAWEDEWRASIETAVTSVNGDARVAVSFVHHDHIFEQFKLNAIDTAQGLFKLTQSAVTAPFRRSRGSDGRLRWTAGLVVQWVENDRIRERTRQLLSDAITQEQPDIILGHSLGSLICYDTFTHPDTSASINGRVFLSFGSQIGNPFVSGQFRAGRIEALARSKHWYHLFNSEDDVFTARIRISDDTFTQIDTFFDIEGIADHDSNQYIRHGNTVSSFWFTQVIGRASAAMPRSLSTPAARTARETRKKPERRALLIGINDYPNPADRLEGCVNDVFLMSSVLQEARFDPEDIRVVLNDRATAKGIRERIEWLLEDVRAGDERVLYYSGHGTQLPTYGAADVTDRMDESLVPYDFDWSSGTTITDDWFYETYSQLPYGMDLVVMFDCCHSGGLTRAGTARVRGLDPPDDIRHRALRWSPELDMWKERDLRTPGKSLYKKLGIPTKRQRLGFANPLRTLPDEEFRKLRKAQGHCGPYMPVMLYACREDESAYEYVHGSVPHGAFTFSLVKTLRRRVHEQRRAVTFRNLVRAVSGDLEDLGYNQHPVIAGPSDKLNAEVPLKVVRRRKSSGR